MYLNKDRVTFSTEEVDALKEWMEKQEMTDPDTSYWLPMYIQF